MGAGGPYLPRNLRESCMRSDWKIEEIVNIHEING